MTDEIKSPTSALIIAIVRTWSIKAILFSYLDLALVEDLLFHDDEQIFDNWTSILLKTITHFVFLSLHRLRICHKNGTVKESIRWRINKWKLKTKDNNTKIMFKYKCLVDLLVKMIKVNNKYLSYYFPPTANILL